MVVEAKINYFNPDLSIQDNFNALVTWANWCLREIQSGRVKMLQNNVNILQETNSNFGLSAGQAAEQLKYAIQLYANTLDEETAMEIATVYPPWNGNQHNYAINDYCTYGVNSTGDPQLYKCLQAHTSQIDWTPDVSPSLFKAIGIADDNIPIWSQPVGSEDAYMKGDKVHYPDAEGDIYESLIDYNVYSPEAYPAGWEKQT